MFDENWFVGKHETGKEWPKDKEMSMSYRLFFLVMQWLRRHTLCFFLTCLVSHQRHVVMDAHYFSIKVNQSLTLVTLKQPTLICLACQERPVIIECLTFLSECPVSCLLVCERISWHTWYTHNSPPKSLSKVVVFGSWSILLSQVD